MRRIVSYSMRRSAIRRDTADARARHAREQRHLSELLDRRAARSAGRRRCRGCCRRSRRPGWRAALRGWAACRRRKRSPTLAQLCARFSRREQCLRMPSRVSNVRFRPSKARVALLELVDDAQALQVVLEAAVLRHAVVRARPGRRGRTACGRGRAPARSPRPGPRSAAGCARSSAPICATSSECVSRVRNRSPSWLTKTCVLYSSRRNAVEWTMRSRSRWNSVRRGRRLGWRRPRVRAGSRRTGARQSLAYGRSAHRRSMRGQRVPQRVLAARCA